MSKLVTIAVAVAAGSVGGLITRYLAPPVASAQTVTKEIRAQSFVLVDPAGNTSGTFTYEPLYPPPPPPPPSPNGPDLRFRSAPPRGSRGRIVLRDSTGREIWSAGGSGLIPLSENIQR
jgi:hypothetical protein